MTARLLRWFEALAAAGLLIGVLVQCTVRDAWPMTSLLFYATPWPVLTMVGAWLGWRWRRMPRLRVAAIGIAVFALTVWFAKDWKLRAPSTGPSDLRIVHWNVARPEGRLPHIVEHLHTYNADVIAVAEAMPKNYSTFERWQAEFPGYEAVISEGEMLCLVRGEVRHREDTWLGPSSYCSALDVTVKGHAFTILQVDIVASPQRSRRSPLNQLARRVVARPDRPLVVLGDFNTPRDSALFAPLRALLLNAWEEAGHGCAETWPMPLPVLSLDHIWLGRLRAVRCEHGISGWSDHRPVVVDLAWP